MRLAALDEAAHDDVFLRGHFIEPYLFDELTQPAAAEPQAPQVSTSEIRRPAEASSCLLGLTFLFGGAAVVSVLAVAGLMRVCERVLTGCR